MGKEIYAIRCKENGKMYIGRTESGRAQARINEHLRKLSYGGHSVEDFQEDFDKYGIQSFEFFVLEQYINDVRGSEKEYEWMRKYKTIKREFGYNYKDKIAIANATISEEVHITYGLPPMKEG